MLSSVAILAQVWLQRVGECRTSAGATRSLVADSTTVLVPQWWLAPPSEWGNGVRTVEPAESTVNHFVNIRKGKDVARKIQLTWLLSRSWPLALTRVMTEEQRQDMAAKENRKLQQKKKVQKDGQKDVQKQMVQKDGQQKKVQKNRFWAKSPLQWFHRYCWNRDKQAEARRL